MMSGRGSTNRSFDAFRNVICRFSQQIDGKAEASTNKKFETEPLSIGNRLAYWHQNAQTTPRWDNARTIAYLSAYVVWGGGSFPADGLRVAEGYVYPDRAVMRALLDARCIQLDNCEFVLTEKGQALIAPFVHVIDGRVRTN